MPVEFHTGIVYQSATDGGTICPCRDDNKAARRTGEANGEIVFNADCAATFVTRACHRRIIKSRQRHTHIPQDPKANLEAKLTLDETDVSKKPAELPPHVLHHDQRLARQEVVPDVLPLRSRPAASGQPPAVVRLEEGQVV